MTTHVRVILQAVLLAFAAGAPGLGQTPAARQDNVILITLDGARVEEMFGGMQLEIPSRRIMVGDERRRTGETTVTLLKARRMSGSRSDRRR